MKRVTIKVNPEVDVKFRKKASQKYRFEKGWYSLAVEDAMKSWISEDITFTIDLDSMMNSINPGLWKELKSELNLDEYDPFENMEDFMNHIDQKCGYNFNINREGEFIEIQLENNPSSSSAEDLKRNLKTSMLLHLLVKVVSFSLEGATREKYEIVGVKSVPEVYLKKLEKD